MQLKTIIKSIKDVSRAATLYISVCVAAICACSLSSCNFEDGRDVYGQSDDFYGTSYVGKWDIDGVAADGARVSAGMGIIIFYDVPVQAIVENIFPDAVVMSATYDPQPWMSTLLDSSAGTSIYSLPAMAWSIRAQIDGDWHDIRLTFASSADAGKPSWVSLADNTGIVNVILHAIAVSVDNGENQAADLTLTFTGKPR